MEKSAYIALGVAGVILVGGLAFVMSRPEDNLVPPPANNQPIVSAPSVPVVNQPVTEPSNGDEPVACTMDARQCPDGSYVGRIAPNCEFAPCPMTNITPEKMVDERYIRPVEWPPEIVELSEDYTCVESATPNASGTMTERRVLGGQEYCVTMSREGAAGSVFTTYNYKFTLEGRVYSLTFEVRAPVCENFDEIARSACETSQYHFSADSLALSAISLLLGAGK